MYLSNGDVLFRCNDRHRVNQRTTTDDRNAFDVAQSVGSGKHGDERNHNGGDVRTEENAV